MRRITAFCLLLLSSLCALAPLRANARAEELLPACCRKAGAHHCAMGAHIAAQSAEHGASLRSTGCLLLPQGASAQLVPAALPGPQIAMVPGAHSSSFFCRAALHGYARTMALRGTRGPPAAASLAS